MSGLYQRALTYVEARRKLRLVRPDEIQEGEDLGISVEERRRIDEQINTIVERNRIKIKPGTFTITARKRGGVFPLFINLVAALLIGAGIYAAIRYFDQREEGIVTQQHTLVSAEGMLLEALRTESEQRLSEKEREISLIQDRLSQVSSEREQLKSTSEAQIREREQELQTAFQAALEEERAKLKARGVEDDQIETRLEALRAEQAATFESQMAAARAQASSELAEKERLIDQLETEYQVSLEQSRSDRDALREEMDQRQAELTAQFQQRQSDLEGERQSALEQLARLQQQRERQNLIFDRILTFYTDVKTAMEAGQYDTADATLTDLESYLGSISMVDYPGISSRRPVELFLVQMLRQELNATAPSASIDTSRLIDMNDQLSRASAELARGEQFFTNEDYATAQEMYVSALSEIPITRQAYERLRQTEERLGSTRETEALGLLQSGNAHYLRGEYEAAAQDYGELLTYLPVAASGDPELLREILDTGFQLNGKESLDRLATLEAIAAERERDLGVIEDLQSQIASQNQEIARLRGVEQTLRSAGTEAGRTATSLQQKIDAQATELARLDDLESQLSQQSTRLEELSRLESFYSDKESILTRLGLLRKRYAALGRSTISGASATDPAAASPGEELAALLETKLIIQRIIETDGVKAEYPDLYDRLNAYLDALAGEREYAARQQTLAGVATILRQLVDDAPGSLPDSAEPLLESGTSFEAVLDSIESLLK